MIHEAAQRMAALIGKKEGYTKEKIDVCAYGFELMISDAIVIIATIIIAWITDVLLYTFLMLLTFIVLRHRTGGFHASSHLRCNLIYFIAYLFYILVIKSISLNMAMYISGCICVFGFVIILKYAPIEHPNNPINENKKTKFRRQSVIFVIIFLVITICFNVISAYGAALSVACGIWYTALSILAEKIKRGYSEMRNSELLK